MFNLSRTAIKFLGLVFFGTASHAMWIERIPIDDLCEIKMYEKGDDADIFTALYSPAPCRVSADCKMEVAIKVWHEIPSDEVMDDYRSYISDHLHMLMVRIANMPGKFALVIELTPYRLEQFYEKYSLTHENIINFAEQIATGLASLHEHKIPPQNFNCSTIFVSKSLMLKIADFGLPELGELGEIESTRWEAPEIELMKAQEVIPRRKAQMMGNMYAFGIILYEMK